MKFDLVRPCENCPFKKSSPAGWLGRKRAAEIAAGITCQTQDATTFSCHKTIDYEALSDYHDDLATWEDAIRNLPENAVLPPKPEKPVTPGTNPDGRHIDGSHCAGALLIYEKTRHKRKFDNFLLQLAERLGLYVPAKLNPSAFQEVFDTFQEFVDHHARQINQKAKVRQSQSPKKPAITQCQRNP